MFAIVLDSESYVKSYSDKVRHPGSVLVDSLPVMNDDEKLHCYQYQNGEFVLDAEKWAAVEAEREKEATIEQIKLLKECIAESDYQIIKCYEYALMNLELPYDVAALHADRQAMRDKINDLEATL